MERKKIEYCGYLIPSQDKEAVLNQMKAYYDDAGYHLVAFFDYEPVGLSKMFRKCRRETLKSIMNRFRAFKPKEGSKMDISFDNESSVFPKYSIVDCGMPPSYKFWKRALEIFINESAHRFIIFINYHKKSIPCHCGGYGHVLYCCEQDEGKTDEYAAFLKQVSERINHVRK
ncbi:MAG: hypothetical protein MdMp014T_0391 [Treponematales bacterium]